MFKVSVSLKSFLRGLTLRSWHFVKDVPGRFKFRHAALSAFLVVSISGVFYYKSFTERCEAYNSLKDDLFAKTSAFYGETGIFIKDMWTQKTIKINSCKLFPSASLVKVPIMAAVFQAEKEGLLNFENEIILRRRHKVWARKGLYRKRCGSKFTVMDLVKRMIITSDNTATNMLVEELGFDYLNGKFIEFGIYDTNLQRGVMELKLRKKGIENYTTAEDMAFLLEKIYKKELVSKEASAKMLDILKDQRVNDRIPYLLPDDLDIAHKTGSLKDTISDVGIVFTKKGDFIICILTLNGRNWRSAKRFIRDVANYTYKNCYGKS
jgi:beta-lactamase class A